MAIYLRVQDQQQARIRWIPFIAPVMTLGRESDNDVVLLRSTVARRHGQIAFLDEQYAFQQLHRPMDGCHHDSRLPESQWMPLPPQKPGTHAESALLVGEFAIDLEEHPADIGRALNQVQTFLREGSAIPASVRVEAALSHAPLPGHLLHHFAADCAERSLLREECAGREPSSRCWEALLVKRRWIEKKASDRERNAAQIEVEKQIFYFFDEELFTSQYASYAAAAAVAAAAMPGAVFAVESNAADWAADAAAAAATAKAIARSHPPRHTLERIWKERREEECEWQCQRLVRLLEQAQETQEKLLSLMLHKQHRLTKAVNLWKDQLEDALY